MSTRHRACDIHLLSAAEKNPAILALASTCPLAVQVF